MSDTALFVGTSGWTYGNWSGAFYPEGMKAAERLTFYARRFNAVELNASFYRAPSQAMIDAWNRRLPDGFRLAAKGARAVTHFKKLEDCREPIAAFCERVHQIRALKVLLWQFPPSLAKDISRLEAFLGDLPVSLRHAVEFRHASWWGNDVADVFQRHNVAMAALSHPQLPDTIYPTADFLYARFHGLGKQLYRYDYSRHELAVWADRLKPYLRDHKVYAFFNNTFYPHAPGNAEVLRDLLQSS